jgi:hypothetical protein
MGSKGTNANIQGPKAFLSAKMLPSRICPTAILNIIMSKSRGHLEPPESNGGLYVKITTNLVRGVDTRKKRTAKGDRIGACGEKAREHNSTVADST